jgi:hypothetical protein
MEKDEWKRMLCSLRPPFRMDLFIDIVPGPDGDLRISAENMLTRPGSRVCIDRYDEANIPDFPDTPEGVDSAKSREFGRVISEFHKLLEEACRQWPVRKKGRKMRKPEPVKDPEFERFVADESVGIQYAARLRYYVDSYQTLFGPPARAVHVLDGSGRCILQPLNTRHEGERAHELVADFLRTHEDRGFQ